MFFLLVLQSGVENISAQIQYPGYITDETGQRDTLSGLPAAKIVINMEMIKRFNSFEAEGDLYSLSQLLTGLDNQTVQDFLHTYRTSDLEEQTLADIKERLEQRQEENERLANQLNDEYFAAIAQMKKEINQKLSNLNQQLVQN